MCAYRENLRTADIQNEAAKSREDMLKASLDVSKFHIVTLKAALAHHGIDTVGHKAALVQRVLEMLQL